MTASQMRKSVKKKLLTRRKSRLLQLSKTRKKRRRKVRTMKLVRMKMVQSPRKGKKRVKMIQ